MQAPAWIRPNWPFTDPAHMDHCLEVDQKVLPGEDQKAERQAQECKDPNGLLPCVHDKPCACGSWSQRHTMNLKGVLRELAIEEVQAAKRRKVS